MGGFLGDTDIIDDGGGDNEATTRDDMKAFASVRRVRVNTPTNKRSCCEREALFFCRIIILNSVCERKILALANRLGEAQFGKS